MRKSLLVLSLGLFLSASVANACDGDKACKTHVKGKKAVAAKTAAKCDMKSGKCDMTHNGGKCDMTAMAKTGAKCDMKAMATGKKDCCKAKAEVAKTPAAPKS